MDIDKATNRLANEIRKVIDAHVSLIEDKSYDEILTSICVALYAETGRLKCLCESTDQVKPDVFDTVFMDGMKRYYEISKSKFCKPN